MPKKHHKFKSFKPEAPVHHSLYSSRTRNDGFHREERSVTDLIQQLRQQQLSRHQARPSAGQFEARSVHPSIRSILNLPATLPPRPRSGLRPQVGARRLRRTPGPAPPLSWLSSNPESEQPQNGYGDDECRLDDFRRCLDQLPGSTFPAERSFLHTILKAMAQNWDWHLVYDGVFLSELPTHIKQLLLSYIAVYADHGSMRVNIEGLNLLFMDIGLDGNSEAHLDVVRLDLCGALGLWTTLKQLIHKFQHESSPSQREDSVPISWEDESPDRVNLPNLTGQQVLKPRFENLRYLSLAQPTPAAANWATLLHLLSNLATLTHLSLAHWPIPTLSVTSARKASSSTTSWQYMISDDDMTEAAIVLGKLSRLTYCLEWLDLDGCTEWLPALCWDREGHDDGFNQPSGPEWNGSWRGIQWLGLKPGWDRDTAHKEHAIGSDETASIAQQQGEIRAPSIIGSENRWAMLRSDSPWVLTNSTPAQVHERNVHSSERIEERTRHQGKMWDLHVNRAKNSRDRIQRLRSEAKGKWIEVCVGDEDEISM